MELLSLLNRYKRFFPILVPSLQFGQSFIFDLHSNKSPFYGITDLHKQMQITARLMQQHKADVGIGVYGEKRFVYEPFRRFSASDRNIHLGIDLMVASDTVVMAPTDAIVHSLHNNQEMGDYGPTLILQHQLEQISFYTLYGHLRKDCLQHWEPGDKVNGGEIIAHVGKHTENGGWPPHLHFQVIDDLGDYKGDYPGVCSEDEKDYFLQNCPDPNLILSISIRNEDASF